VILADTDVLSATAKTGRLSLLFMLFRTTALHVTPGVFTELAYSFNRGRQYAIEVFTLLTAGQIQIVYPTQDEVAFGNGLPASLGIGERESIAVARVRGGTILSNESRVAHYCRQYGIWCLRLPDILRALWVEGIVSREEVQDIVRDMQAADRMQFKPSVLGAIFADEP
jgi:predicted nucleic acid-binding protein